MQLKELEQKVNIGKGRRSVIALSPMIAFSK